MPTVYEKRTYAVTVGQMAEVVRLYTTQGWPAQLRPLVKTQSNQLLAAPWGHHP